MIIGKKTSFTKQPHRKPHRKPYFFLNIFNIKLNNKEINQKQMTGERKKKAKEIEIE